MNQMLNASWSRLGGLLQSALRFTGRLKKSADQPGKWENGVDYEVEFWGNFFRTKGLQWPDDYKTRLRPDVPLAETHAQLIAHIDEEPVRILDVGAGPLTMLGKRHPQKQLSIVATDALAPQYDQLLREFNIKPPVRTIEAAAERLLDTFPANSFHLVHATNSIDHSKDPVKAIEQMIAVAKPGCYVAMYHYENEGETEKYEGFHQWNFTVKNGDFVIRDRFGKSVNVTKRFSRIAEIESCIADIESCIKRYVQVHIKKR
jgi:ubiquinone/menaquinone biosynthesis C-methylase UbiE